MVSKLCLLSSGRCGTSGEAARLRGRAGYDPILSRMGLGRPEPGGDAADRRDLEAALGVASGVGPAGLLGAVPSDQVGQGVGNVGLRLLGVVDLGELLVEEVPGPVGRRAGQLR